MAVQTDGNHGLPRSAQKPPHRHHHVGGGEPRRLDRLSEVAESVVGVIDESAPADRGSYTVGLAVIQGDPDAVRVELRSRFARIRPFHWVDDRGSVVRQRVMEPFTMGAVSASLAAFKDPEALGVSRARARLLRRDIVPWALEAGVTELLIERR